MTGPRWPRTCSHPIYARTLTGVYQVVRMFSPSCFHVIIFIGILESNSLSLSTTKWIERETIIIMMNKLNVHKLNCM